MNPVQIYRRLAELPVFTSLTFDSQSHVSVELSVRDHVNNVKRSIIRSVHLPSNSISAPVEKQESIVARLVSPSGKRTAILKETTSTPKKRFIEIWTDNSKAELILETTARHGAFYADDALLYTAESNTPTDPLEKFTYTSDYGEAFIGRRRPSLFYLRWRPSSPSSKSPQSTSRLVQIIPSVAGEARHFALGQATFASKDGRTVVSTAYFNTDGERKLGIVYCWNRPSAIVHLTLPDNPIPDSEDDQSLKEKKIDEKEVSCTIIYNSRPCRSPRVHFSEGGPVVIFLSSDLGPHGSCSRLHSVTLLPTGQIKDDCVTDTVVDAVWEPAKHVDKGGFPGLYISHLPLSPFIYFNGTLYALAVSNWGCHQVLLAIAINGNKKGNVLRLPGPNGRDAAGLISTLGGIVVATFSSLTAPNELFSVHLENQDIQRIQWTKLTSIGDDVADLVSTLETGVLDVPNCEPVQTIYLKTRGEETKPLITFPHGGPHVATSSIFSVEAVAFVLSGYTLHFPNYRGSLAFGQRYVQALLGRIGRLDVDDVMSSIRAMISNGFAKEGKEWQVYMGGSHSGFIGAHVIGQYPEFFSACILRNPVINVASMYSTTDIPDWCVVEAGDTYIPALLPSPDLYRTLYSCSPLQYAERVCTPLLLRLGGDDRRVPPTQGKEYYHLLRSMEKEVECLWFEGNGHALDKVEAETIGWEKSLQWFEKWRGTEQAREV